MYSLDKIVQELASQAQTIVGGNMLPEVALANPNFGADFAVACFKLASQTGQNPHELAIQLASKLQHPALQKAEATAGFVNLWLKPEALAQGLQKDTGEHEAYGQHADGQGKIAIVEFPSPNMAKPFSVGHLRPAVQGWAIAQLMKAMGYRVITDNHLGDWGTPFGKWVVGFRRYSSDEQLARAGIHELARVYIRITADLKAEKEQNNHELADEVQSWLLKLEDGDTEALSYSRRFADISIGHMHQVLERLGITTDYEFGEAFYIPKAKKMVEDLVQKGVAQRQADGSVIVSLDEYGIKTPILLEKSNGAALYATSDLATLEFRIEKWHPDKVIYVVAAEQQFHFKQIFALANKLGYKSEYLHYWFGLIDQIDEAGARSKMSSRKGVVLLEDLLDTAESEARKHAANPGELSDQSVKQIALGAIKFTDFAQDKKTSILFDWDRIFNLRGYSGAYVQYAAVRVKAILDKFGRQTQPATGYDWRAEHDILLCLALYPQIVRAAANQYEPHRIAQYAYNLARELNKYYETTNVGAAEQPAQSARLWLLGVVQQNFEHALGLLGIEIPDKM
ncbi:MAG TPA: arginine--tRNA ligase [Candidatus Acidoferrum sp.]|nr:arginine--tRNA ligase [Candidatus Acidoferrum sp.]